jgi:hypothetical protein
MRQTEAHGLAAMYNILIIGGLVLFSFGMGRLLNKILNLAVWQRIGDPLYGLWCRVRVFLKPDHRLSPLRSQRRPRLRSGDSTSRRLRSRFLARL